MTGNPGQPNYTSAKAIMIGMINSIADEYGFFFYCYGYHRDLHVKRHSFPTRRSSDLVEVLKDVADLHAEEDDHPHHLDGDEKDDRSEEHTSELQSPLNISYAVFCL